MATRRSPLQALSQAPFAARLLTGPVMQGTSLGRGHLLFPTGVLSLTEPGALRMPNGIESALLAPKTGTPVQVGGGSLVCDAATVHEGPIWDPRPRPRFAVSTCPTPLEQTLISLAGLGPGLTPLGDDVLVGYLGARALFGEGWQLSLAARTTSLSATLLRLAAHGHLPEAAHRLLEDGDPEPLLGWGANSGLGVLAGLGMCTASADTPVVRSIELVLPFETPRLVWVEIRPT